ncbi:hypothetical protein [Pontibacter kalidii]|uniref:hypothetical protein n=1 Tax=Pontibacter kalidii TaxID=2592049 RepID=UPI00225720ED|nr:hypothetical protein [Pontibacter kalidii]
MREAAAKSIKAQAHTCAIGSIKYSSKYKSMAYTDLVIRSRNGSGHRCPEQRKNSYLA